MGICGSALIAYDIADSAKENITQHFKMDKKLHIRWNCFNPSIGFNTKINKKTVLEHFFQFAYDDFTIYFQKNKNDKRLDAHEVVYIGKEYARNFSAFLMNCLQVYKIDDRQQWFNEYNSHPIKVDDYLTSEFFKNVTRNGELDINSEDSRVVEALGIRFAKFFYSKLKEENKPKMIDLIFEKLHASRRLKEQRREEAEKMAYS